MTGKWHGGKGSKYRPVDNKKYSDNWDKIFGNKEKEAEEKDLKFTTAEDYMRDDDQVISVTIDDSYSVNISGEDVTGSVYDVDTSKITVSITDAVTDVSTHE